MLSSNVGDSVKDRGLVTLSLALSNCEVDCETDLRLIVSGTVDDIDNDCAIEKVPLIVVEILLSSCDCDSDMVISADADVLPTTELVVVSEKVRVSLPMVRVRSSETVFRVGDRCDDMLPEGSFVKDLLLEFVCKFVADLDTLS